MHDIKNSSKNKTTLHSVAQLVNAANVLPLEDNRFSSQQRKACLPYQKKQNVVKPAMQLKAKVNVNDDKSLENEADVMGAKSLAVAQRKAVSELKDKPVSSHARPLQMFWGQETLGKIGGGIMKGGRMLSKAAAAHPYIAGAVSVGVGLLGAPLTGAGLLGATVVNAMYRNSGVLKGPKTGQKGLEDLPQNQMWRMYINPKDHQKALAASRTDERMTGEPGKYYEFYDENDQRKDPKGNPGAFGESMTSALKEQLLFSKGNLGRQLDYDDYAGLHDLVTSKFSKGNKGARGSKENMRQVSGNDTTATGFPLNDWDDQPTRPAGDLLDERVNNMDMVLDYQGGRVDNQVNKKVTMYDPDNSMFRVMYTANRNSEIATGILNRYYGEVKSAKTKKQKINAIVKAVRAIHVAHPFKDANGRLHVQLMLNKFLLEQGFSPAILGKKGLGVFGGAFSVDELRGEVEEGMNRFDHYADGETDEFRSNYDL